MSLGLWGGCGVGEEAVNFHFNMTVGLRRSTNCCYGNRKDVAPSCGLLADFTGLLRRMGLHFWCDFTGSPKGLTCLSLLPSGSQGKGRMCSLACGHN